MKMYIVQKYTKKWKIKNKNTHAGLIGTHELYHKINVFAVKTIQINITVPNAQQFRDHFYFINVRICHPYSITQRPCRLFINFSNSTERDTKNRGTILSITTNRLIADQPTITLPIATSFSTHHHRNFIFTEIR